MCMILYKPAGETLPSEHFLRKIGYQNPDGFGFITSNRAVKSLNLEKFLKILKTIPEDQDIIIHWRMATQGSVNLDNCHPFKFVSSDTKLWMAHNGCLPMPRLGDKTDSEIFLKHYVGPTLVDFGMDSVEMKRLLSKKAESSRLAFFYNKEVYLYGTWYKYKGCYYSNTRPFHFSNIYGETALECKTYTRAYKLS